MLTQIKICGLTTAAAVDAAIAQRADHVGLVFFAQSPRNLSLSDANALASRVAGRTRTVGVFVDPDDALLTAAVSAGPLDVIQLHGHETPARVAAVRSLSGLPVWKAIAVRTVADIAAADRYHGAADLLLFDAKTPDGAALPGGMGVRFDWTLLAGYRGATAWGLSGGLSPANIAEALSVTAAPLVDVSSGVESEPGIKDVDKIAAFAYAVRRHDDR